MIRKGLTGVLAAIAILASGCDLVTEPTNLEEFEYIAVENPADIMEGIQSEGFFGDIGLLGQLKTPTLCFSLKAQLDKDGSTLTLSVDATSTNSPNCIKNPGGFRYTAVLRRLDRGTYTVRVIHTVPGMTTLEYTTTVTI